MKILAVASFLAFLQMSGVYSSQRDVYKSIFKDYEKDLRPVRNDSTQMNVGIQLQIMSLLEVNAEQEYIKAAIYIDQSWTDEYLVWNPSDFSGTSVIMVAASEVWLPDIAVETSSLEPEYFMPLDDRIVFIYNDGTDYPFDTQECLIRIGSWAYTRDMLNLYSSYEDYLSMPENNNTVWEIFPYVNETFVSTFGNETYVELWYRQKIKRKTRYYVWVLIVPTFIITALSLAGLYSPFNNLGDREEKVSLGLTTLLTLAVILTMVTDEMPRGSTLPRLGLFVLLEITMIVVSMAISVITIFLHQRVTTRSWPIPSWLTWFCLPKRKDKISDEQQVIYTKAHAYSSQLGAHFDSNVGLLFEQAFLLRACLHQLKETHAKVSEWMKDNEKDEIRKHNWLMIFDRIDLILFVLFQVIHLIAFILVFYRYFDTLS